MRERTQACLRIIPSQTEKALRKPRPYSSDFHLPYWRGPLFSVTLSGASLTDSCVCVCACVVAIFACSKARAGIDPPRVFLRVPALCRMAWRSRDDLRPVSADPRSKLEPHMRRKLVRFGQHWSSLAHVWPNLTEMGPTSANSRRNLSGVCRHLFGKYLGICGHFWTTAEHAGVAGGGLQPGLANTFYATVG